MIDHDDDTYETPLLGDEVMAAVKVSPSNFFCCWAQVVNVVDEKTIEAKIIGPSYWVGALRERQFRPFDQDEDFTFRLVDVDGRKTWAAA
jgi:hypothetical protein